PGKLEIIQKIHLKNDDVAALNQGEAEVVFAYSEENRQVIFDILNFYEMLSAAIINRHLDEETMRQIAGYRIFTAYKKLSPFIVICQRYNDGDNRPYQHYEELYTEWKRYYSGREDPAR
ncbi:MAG: DUF4760 domain-containing protein, partial [Oscillospiraceae bacterium]|nr:DUF4760 domain-containing protein [Oscillospiraceae bacterium]